MSSDCYSNKFGKKFGANLSLMTVLDVEPVLLELYEIKKFVFSEAKFRKAFDEAYDNHNRNIGRFGAYLTGGYSAALEETKARLAVIGVSV